MRKRFYHLNGLHDQSVKNYVASLPTWDSTWTKHDGYLYPKGFHILHKQIVNTQFHPDNNDKNNNRKELIKVQLRKINK